MNNPFRAANAVLLSGSACGLLSILLSVLYFTGELGSEVKMAIYALTAASIMSTVTGIAMSVAVRRRKT